MRGDLKIEGIEQQNPPRIGNRLASFDGGPGLTLRGRLSDPATWESSTLSHAIETRNLSKC
jgi:hypothetical protein